MVSVSTELRVKQLLKERQWTTKMLAERTGLSESYLTHIKNCTRRWNEDILKRLADAFEIEPTELLMVRKRSNETDGITSKDVAENGLASVVPRKVPVMKDIPAHPSPYNNELMQLTSGNKGVFMPVLGIDDPDMFCIRLENSSLRPRFTKGDLIVVSPMLPISSGDVVAVEYGEKNIHRTFMQVSFGEDLVILESLSHKHPPIALSKSKDNYRFIGKVALRFQSLE